MRPASSGRRGPALGRRRAISSSSSSSPSPWGVLVVLLLLATFSIVGRGVQACNICGCEDCAIANSRNRVNFRYNGEKIKETCGDLQEMAHNGDFEDEFCRTKIVQRSWKKCDCFNKFGELLENVYAKTIPPLEDHRPTPNPGSFPSLTLPGSWTSSSPSQQPKSVQDGDGDGTTTIGEGDLRPTASPTMVFDLDTGGILPPSEPSPAPDDTQTTTATPVSDGGGGILPESDVTPVLEPPEEETGGGGDGLVPESGVTPVLEPEEETGGGGDGLVPESDVTPVLEPEDETGGGGGALVPESDVTPVLEPEEETGGEGDGRLPELEEPEEEAGAGGGGLVPDELDVTPVLEPEEETGGEGDGRLPELEEPEEEAGAGGGGLVPDELDVTTVLEPKEEIEVSEVFEGISMVLEGCTMDFDETTTKTWIAMTKVFYENVHGGVQNEDQQIRQRMRQLQTLGIRDFATEITFEGQEVSEADNASTILYTQSVRYIQTSESAPSAFQLLQDPFRNEALNKHYVDLLKDRGEQYGVEALASIQGGLMAVPIIPNAASDNGNGGTNNPFSQLSTGVIAGIAVGGAVVLALLYYVCCRKRDYGKADRGLHTNVSTDSSSGDFDYGDRDARDMTDFEDPMDKDHLDRSYHDDGSLNSRSSRSNKSGRKHRKSRHSKSSRREQPESGIPNAYIDDLFQQESPARRSSSRNSSNRQKQERAAKSYSDTSAVVDPNAKTIKLEDLFPDVDGMNLDEIYLREDNCDNPFQKERSTESEDTEYNFNLAFGQDHTDQNSVISGQSGSMVFADDDGTYESTDQFRPFHYHQEQHHQHHQPQPQQHQHQSARNGTRSGGASREPHVFVIDAPPGWLGVVIDTPEDMGPPVVYEIMENSPIATQIRLGDQLISVDEVNVDRMTASQVSKLIAQKASNPFRRLRVIRLGPNGMAPDSIV